MILRNFFFIFYSGESTQNKFVEEKPRALIEKSKSKRKKGQTECADRDGGCRNLEALRRSVRFPSTQQQETILSTLIHTKQTKMIEAGSENSRERRDLEVHGGRLGPIDDQKEIHKLTEGEEKTIAKQFLSSVKYGNLTIFRHRYPPPATRGRGKGTGTGRETRRSKWLNPGASSRNPRRRLFFFLVFSNGN